MSDRGVLEHLPRHRPSLPVLRHPLAGLVWAGGASTRPLSDPPLLRRSHRLVGAAKAMREEEMLAEIEDFIEGFNQPTYRGLRINGRRVATWSSQHGWSGM
jgi:hypothetical protein